MLCGMLFAQYLYAMKNKHKELFTALDPRFIKNI